MLAFKIVVCLHVSEQCSDKCLAVGLTSTVVVTTGQLLGHGKNLKVGIFMDTEKCHQCQLCRVIILALAKNERFAVGISFCDLDLISVLNC